eukprot:7095930-Prymnesium_polylepis.1
MRVAVLGTKRNEISSTNGRLFCMPERTAAIIALLCVEPILPPLLQPRHSSSQPTQHAAAASRKMRGQRQPMKS